MAEIGSSPAPWQAETAGREGEEEAEHKGSVGRVSRDGARTDATGVSRKRARGGEEHALEAPRTEMVRGAPLRALRTTRCMRAPVPTCSLLLSRPAWPRRLATSSPGPYTGQNGNGAGSASDAFR